VCNGVPVICYGACNACNGFWTDTVKTHPDIAEDAMISVLLILQSDHKGRLQNTRVVRVFLKFSRVLNGIECFLYHWEKARLHMNCLWKVIGLQELGEHHFINAFSPAFTKKRSGVA
jgi:hypothetical protein